MENKDKNGFVVIWVSCIVVLLTLCFFGISDSLKGTSAASCTGGYKLEYYCPSGGSLSGTSCIVTETSTINQTFTSTSRSCPSGWSGSCSYIGGAMYSCSCSQTVNKDSSYAASSKNVCQGWSSCDFGSYGECMGAGRGDCSIDSNGCYVPSGGDEYNCDDSCEYYYEPDGYTCTSYKNECGKTCYKACLKDDGDYGECMTEAQAKNAGEANCPSGTSPEVTLSNGCYNYDCKKIDTSDNKGECYTEQGHCRSDNGGSCYYKFENGKGCWYAGSLKDEDPTDNCPAGTVTNSQGTCTGSSNIKYNCNDAYGLVAGGYWGGRVTEYENENGTSSYTFVCTLHCNSGYTIDKNGTSCVKCEDCEGENCPEKKCDFETEASCKDGTGYNCRKESDNCWYPYISGYPDDDEEPSNPPSSEPSDNPSDSSKPSSSSNPSSSSSTHSSVAASGCYKNKDTGEFKYFEKTPDKDLYEKVDNSKCEQNVTENPPTGQIMMFIMWIIGFASIGYSVYYMMRFNKAE